jgi:hypothetical protein
MLQITAPALSQFTRGPRSRHVVPVPGSTSNGVEVANNLANGTETLKTQLLDAEMNQKLEKETLQFITDIDE